VIEPAVERPQGVVVICTYELIAIAIVLAGLGFTYFVHISRPELAQVHLPLWKAGASWLNIALMVSATVSLWMLRRAALFLFAAKFLLSTFLFAANLLHPTRPVIRPRLTPPIPHSQRPANSLIVPYPAHVSPPPAPLNVPPLNPSPLKFVRRAGTVLGVIFLFINGAIVFYCYQLLIAPRPPSRPVLAPQTSWPLPPR
jgi:hypothetical protein